MPPKSATLDQVMELIREGQTSARDRHDDLKSDFESKHTENRERRHALGNEISNLEGRQGLAEARLATAETKLISIVGDSSGGSGLLHEIRGDVKDLKNEVAGIKKTVEDTPTVTKYIYGVMAVLAFLAFAVPIGLTILFFVVEVALKLIFKH